MKLNIEKTKNIIFNFSKDNQFTTEIELDGKVIETVKETKLLGTVITDKLDWNRNTDKIVNESNRRMETTMGFFHCKLILDIHFYYRS